MWRKNRRKNRWGMGVDNNRNYSYKWGGPGASGSSWSDTFRGPSAMSEIENQVIANLQEEARFQCCYFISFLQRTYIVALGLYFINANPRSCIFSEAWNNYG